MKTPLTIATALSACMMLAGSVVGVSREVPATKEITKSIRQFYEAMGARDVEALRHAVYSTFIVVEAGREHAKVHLVNAGETSELLPPEGNDDWDNVQVTDLTVSLASMHPTVATVSYRVLRPFPPDRLKMLEEMLKATPSPFDEALRQQISKWLADKGIMVSECAMLGFLDGRWRIVSISVAK